MRFATFSPCLAHRMVATTGLVISPMVILLVLALLGQVASRGRLTR